MTDLERAQVLNTIINKCLEINKNMNAHDPSTYDLKKAIWDLSTQQIMLANLLLECNDLRSNRP